MHNLIYQIKNKKMFSGVAVVLNFVNIIDRKAAMVARLIGQSGFTMLDLWQFHPNFVQPSGNQGEITNIEDKASYSFEGHIFFYQDKNYFLLFMGKTN